MRQSDVAIIARARIRTAPASISVVPRLVTLTALLALAVGCSSASQGSLTVKLASCQFNNSSNTLVADVTFTNDTGSDADLSTTVYWLTSVTPSGAFGNGSDGTLSSSVIRNDYVDGSEPAGDPDSIAGLSDTIEVDIPLGEPRPAGLRCVLGPLTNLGPPFAS
jgi:hypothetical protein